MKTFLGSLILAAFLQSSFLPINLTLILLISRAFVRDDTENLYFAFILGVSLGLLTATNIGFWPLAFLLTVKLASLAKRLPFTQNQLTILPIGGLIILLISFLEKLVFGTTMNFNRLLLETFLTLPIFILVKFWEERFVVKPEMKLKVK